MVLVCVNTAGSQGGGWRSQVDEEVIKWFQAPCKGDRYTGSTIEAEVEEAMEE
jgi:hypothetical protein